MDSFVSLDIIYRCNELYLNNIVETFVERKDLENADFHHRVSDILTFNDSVGETDKGLVVNVGL